MTKEVYKQKSLSVITKNLNQEILHFMWIISSHQAEFSYLAFFELVRLTLAPINIDSHT